MKPINCPLEEKNKTKKSYLRFINKDTLEYLDMPIIRGKNASIYFHYLDILENADEIVGNAGIVFRGGNIPRKFHYMVLFSVDENKKLLYDSYAGFMRRKNKFYTALIDIETNELLEAHNIPKFYDDNQNPIEATGISIIKEKGKYYRYRKLYTPENGVHKEKILSKRKISYDKIFG